MLQLLTPTGCRPLAWALAQRFAARQTYAGPVRWIVVDDGDPAQTTTVRDGWTLEVLRPTPRWTSGQNTQARNLLAGLEAVDPGHPVVVWEDDDWYAPDWLETVAAALEGHELVGESRIHYYHVGTRRWQRMRNAAHAALSATALRGAALETFRAVLRETPTVTERQALLIDARLWRAHPDRALFDGARVVSLKGLPGRAGLGVGHRPTFGEFHDADGSQLRALLGPDAAWYQVAA